jgi:hypothetical protein
MDLRAFTNVQMTMLLVTLCQILTITHMLPLESPSSRRRSELDLLLDPVHQEQLEELETKRVFPKSVYNTGLRVTTESPCNVGTQRAKEGGPCLRINSSQGSFIDEKYLSSVLKNLPTIRQEALSNNRNRNRNRHRTRTTTTTTEFPFVQSTLQQVQGELFDYDEYEFVYLISNYSNGTSSFGSSRSCSLHFPVSHNAYKSIISSLITITISLYSLIIIFIH